MNHRRNYIIFFSIMLVLMIAASGTVAQGKVEVLGSRSFTAMGTAFTYQARLNDGGKPANGFYDFEFKLYDSLSSGNKIGNTVSFDNRQVSDGLCTVDLDFGADAFNGEARWLDISVRPGASSGAFTVLSPRQPITPAPYALYADKAGSANTAGSVPWTGITGVPAGFADGVDNDGTGLFWSLNGNASISTSNFLGATNNITMTLGTNNTAVLKLAPNSGRTGGQPSVNLTVNHGGRNFNTGTSPKSKIGEYYRDNSIIAWARVNANGDLWTDFGINYVSHPGIGYYRIHINELTVEGASLIAVVSPEIDTQPTSLAEMRFAVINQVGEGPSEVFEVYMVDGTGAAINNDFMVIVTGR